MRLLRDEDLIASITAASPAVPYAEGVKLPDNRYSKESPVQAASIDLHIGDIYLPGKKETEIGGTKNSKLDVELETGATAVVTTREILHLPANIAGIGFPPSRVSFKGLLVTNPGHVDPGYEGVMRFTVINMAKEPYHLKTGDRIVRLLLFEMDKAAQSDWRQRNPDGSQPPTQVDINLLSRDFVDVERRAETIARKHSRRVSTLIAGGFTVITLILGAVSSGQLFRNATIEDLKKKQDILDYDLKNRVEVERKLQDFDNRLKELQEAISEQKKAQNAGKTARNGSSQ
jgi:dCTP deaminase